MPLPFPRTVYWAVCALAFVAGPLLFFGLPLLEPPSWVLAPLTFALWLSGLSLVVRGQASVAGGWPSLNGRNIALVVLRTTIGMAFFASVGLAIAVASFVRFPH